MSEIPDPRGPDEVPKPFRCHKSSDNIFLTIKRFCCMTFEFSSALQ